MGQSMCRWICNQDCTEGQVHKYLDRHGSCLSTQERILHEVKREGRRHVTVYRPVSYQPYPQCSAYLVCNAQPT